MRQGIAGGLELAQEPARNGGVEPALLGGERHDLERRGDSDLREGGGRRFIWPTTGDRHWLDRVRLEWGTRRLAGLPEVERGRRRRDALQRRRAAKADLE